MIQVEFSPENVGVRLATMGGGMRLEFPYTKFPKLAEFTNEEREHLGSAITLAIANLQYQEAKVSLQMAVDVAHEVAGPQLVVPSKELVLP